MRHPLERLLSAYRHVFERENTYEDEFMKVVSLKQVERNKGLLESNANQVKLATWLSFLMDMGKLNFDHVHF